MRRVLSMVLLLLAAACAPLAERPASTISPSMAAQAADVGQRVAAWHIAHSKDDSIATRWASEVRNQHSWVQGAGYTGLLRWARISGSPTARNATLAWARANKFELGPRKYHADDHTVGQVYLKLREMGLAGDEALAPTKAKFDSILASPPTGDLAMTDGGRDCSDRWCWSDALFMAPPVWEALSKATGDPRYAAFSDREFWATTDFLFDKQEGLYYRDSRFITRKGPAGEKIFWSRGNGWVAGGIINLLEVMPANAPERRRYEDLLRAMATGIKRSQKPDGYWTPSLAAPSGVPEISGSAFFVYALQRGIDLNVLPAAEYAPVVQRGWAAIVRHVGPDGRVGSVQQIGDAPDEVKPDSTQLYGSGAVLLAASALVQAGNK
ncbi:MAG TPA: glycoside hydrolase family 88 protein [Sphingomicrobium sp.]